MPKVPTPKSDGLRQMREETAKKHEAKSGKKGKPRAIKVRKSGRGR